MLSQWAPVPSAVKGVRYNYAEKFMMADKAHLFSDEVARFQFMAPADPKQHKRFGRGAHNSDHAVLEKQRGSIVLRGTHGEKS